MSNKRNIRLTTPLVRENGSLRPASLGRGARPRRRRVPRRGRRSRAETFGMFSCSKATNEMNFVAQKFARVGDRQQQHRQLQPHLTRPERRRSGDGVRGGRRDELLPRDRGDGRHPPVGIERARDASDLLPPRAARACTTAPGSTWSIRGARARRSGPTSGSALDVGTDIALANAMAREIIAAGLENRELHRARHQRLRGVPRVASSRTRSSAPRRSPASRRR